MWDTSLKVKACVVWSGFFVSCRGLGVQGVGSPLRRGHSFPELHNKSIVRRVHVFSASHTSGRHLYTQTSWALHKHASLLEELLVICTKMSKDHYITGLSSNKSQWLLQRAAVRVSCQRRSTHCISQGVCLHLSCLSGGEDSNNFWGDSDVTTLQHLHLDYLQFRFVLVRFLCHSTKRYIPASPIVLTCFGRNSFTLDQQCLCISADKCSIGVCKITRFKVWGQ